MSAAEGRSSFKRFLHSRYAPLLTHFSLVTLAGSMFALLLWAPLWIAAVPGVLLCHRSGIILHEYIHGIPFRRYKHNLWVLSAYEGLMITFGFLEVFRGVHLAHHRWLNTENDPAYTSGKENRPQGLIERLYWFMESSHYFKYLYESFRGSHPLVNRNRVILDALLSLASIVFWILIGQPWMPLKIVAFNLYTVIVPSSLRGALDHQSYPGNPNSTNEYKVLIPLFNLNRHIHHHIDPICPWYLLEYRTPNPMPVKRHLAHWYHVFIKRDYVFMPPPQ